MANMPVPLAAHECLREWRWSPRRPSPAVILSALFLGLLGPLRRTAQARVQAHTELDTDCSLASQSGSLSASIICTQRLLSASAAPQAHRPQRERFPQENSTRPRPKGKRRYIRPVQATAGNDVRVSTCKMAAHHRQNTAGRRKVQVGDPGSSTSRAWLASPGPPPASRYLGPRSAEVAAWGERDGARPAARGGAAALTA